MDNDQTEEVGEFTFVIEKELLQSIGSVNIDVSYMGFIVEPERPLNSASSGCSSCASGSCAV